MVKLWNNKYSEVFKLSTRTLLNKIMTKKFIEICVFIIAIGTLAWQSHNTFETYIAGRTTFAISKQTSDSMTPPTIVVCQTHKWNNGLTWKKVNTANILDKDWFDSQFYWLNDKINISYISNADTQNLTL